MTATYDEGHCKWFDFEPEPEVTGDGTGDPEKYILTIANEHGEEIATIVHRLAGGRFPIDGDEAERKRRNAQVIVNALNENRSGSTFAEELE